MNAAAATDAFVRTLDTGQQTITYAVEGVRCGSCTSKIEKRLRAIDGVGLARANATTKRLRVIWNPARTNLETLVGAVESIGFSVHPLASVEQKGGKESLLGPLAVSGFATMNVMAFSFAVWAGLVTDMGPATIQFLHWFSAAVVIPANLYSGQIFFRGALTDLKYRRLTMDTPIAFAILITLGASFYETLQGSEHVYFDAAISLTFFLLIGRVLDKTMRAKSETASENFRALTDVTALKLDPDGHPQSVHAASLEKGDVILVPRGGKTAVEGILLSEACQIDTSAMTGESLPAYVKRGGKVRAGSIVLDEAVRLQVLEPVSEGELQQIADLIEAAEQNKGSAQLLADRFATAYGPTVLIGGLLGFCFWYLFLGADISEAMMIAVAVLIVTCPCAAGLATPAVAVRAVNLLLENGVIAKSGDALERLADVDTVIFDKTGTLTDSELSLSEDHDPSDLEAAAALAGNSHHPLAQALYRKCPVTPTDGAKEFLGEGLEAPDGSQLGSAAFVGEVSNACGDLGVPEIWFRNSAGRSVRFTFHDTIRPSAISLINKFKECGIEVIVLSGDGEVSTERVATKLDADHWYGSKSPQEKQAIVQELSDAGRKVLMIGDGINDAPSLAAAHISISPAGAASISQLASDMVITANSLTPVAVAFDVSRRSSILVRQNLSFATLYNVVTIPLALAGMLTPLIAAILMSSSSILVMANGLRLRS